MSRRSSMARCTSIVPLATSLAMACGEVLSNNSSPDPIDASADAEFEASVGADSNTTDAGAAPCSPNKPFGPLEVVDGVNTPDYESSAQLTANELVIYFTRGPVTARRIFRGVRSSREGAFTVAEVLTIGSAFGAAVTPTDSTLYFTREDAGNTRIFSALHTGNGQFTEAVLTPGVNSMGNVAYPFPSADGTELFFAAIVAANWDLYRAPIGEGGVVGNPVALSTLNNGASYDGEPVLSSDGLTLYFYSDRGHDAGVGMPYKATRDSLTAEFRNPDPVTELAPTAAQRYISPTWLSPDGCRLYVYALGDVGRASEIFVAKRAP